MSTPSDSETESEGGSGIVSAAKSALTSILHGGRRSAPPAVRKILEQNPNAKIVKAQAGIVPVGKHLQSVLNWISGGKYEEKRQKLGYNDINHAYMIVTLNNGKTYRLEKNHVVEMYSYNVSNDKNAKIDLKLSGEPLLSSFLDNAEKYQESTKAEGKRGNFWQYDPQNNNCQYFIDDLVKGNPEVQNKEEANKFFFQPGSGELIDSTGKWKPHIKFLVPLATIGDRLIHGEGGRPDPGRPHQVNEADVRTITRALQRARARVAELLSHIAEENDHDPIAAGQLEMAQAQVVRLERLLATYGGNRGGSISQPRCAHRYRPY